MNGSKQALPAAPSLAARRLRPPARKRIKTFLEHLAAAWSVTESAAAAGVDKRRFYELRAQDEEFAAEWEEANQSGADIVEDELRRRAFGYDEETWDGDGNLLRRVKRKDTQALLAMARARRPEKFRDNMRVEHSGPAGGPIVTEHREKLSLEAALVQVKERREVAARAPLELPAAGASGEAS